MPPEIKIFVQTKYNNIYLLRLHNLADQTKKILFFDGKNNMLLDLLIGGDRCKAEINAFAELNLSANQYM